MTPFAGFDDLQPMLREVFNKSGQKALEETLEEAFESWIATLDAEKAITWLNLFHGLGDWIAVVPPEFYTFALSFVGGLVSSNKLIAKNYPFIALGVPIVLNAVGPGLRRLLDKAKKDKKPVSVDAVKEMILGRAASMGFVGTDAPTSPIVTSERAKTIFDVVTVETLAHLTGLIWALEDEIGKDRRAQDGDDEMFVTLAGRANALRSNLYGVIRKHPDALAVLLKPGLDFNKVRKDPMKYGAEIFALVQTFDYATAKDKAWDTVDLWVPTHEIRDWLKAHMAKQDTVIAAIAIPFSIGLQALAAATALFAAWVTVWLGFTLSLFGVGAVLYLGGLFGRLYGVLGTNDALTSLNFGMAALFISGMLFSQPGNWFRAIGNIFRGKRKMEQGFLGRNVTRLIRTLQNMGLPVPDEHPYDWIEPIDPEVEGAEAKGPRGNTWFLNTRTSVMLVTLGVVTVADLVMVLVDFSWDRMMVVPLLMAFWFIALTHEYFTRSGFEFPWQDGREIKRKIRNWLQTNALVSVKYGLIATCVSGVLGFTFIGALLQGGYYTAVQATADYYEIDLSNPSGTLASNQVVVKQIVVQPVAQVPEKAPKAKAAPKVRAADDPVCTFLPSTPGCPQQ